MKWGVRRYQNKDGSLTPAGKRQQEKYDKLVKEYKNQGYSDDKADVEAMKSLGRQRALKTLAVVGGVTAVTAGVIVARKAYKYRVDNVIKAGTTFQRVTTSEVPNIDRPFYTTNKKGDMKKYEGLYSKQLRFPNLAQQLQGTVPHDNVNVVGIKNNKDLKVISQKKALQNFEHLYNTDPEFKEFARDNAQRLRMSGSTKKMYEAFNRRLVDHTPEATKQANKFYDVMKKQGYSAIQDINDMKYSGYRAKNPIIVFDNSDKKMVVDSVRKMSDDEIKKKGTKATAKLYLGIAARDPMILGTAGVMGAAAVSGQLNKRQVEQYKQLHPNSKLTDRQIMKLLDIQQ